MLNYEEIRVNAAMNVMNAILSSSLMFLIVQFIMKKEIADVCIKYADALVEELKNREEKK